MERAEVEVMESERLTAEMAFRDPTSIVIKIRRRLPDFLQSVKLKYVRLGYRYSSLPSPNSLLLLLASSAALLLALLLHRHLLLLPHQLPVLLSLSAAGGVEYYPSTAVLRLVLAALAVLLAAYYLRLPSPVYLVDFACFKPDQKNKISREAFLAMTNRVGVFNDDNTEFQSRITWRSGLGDETYLPDGILADPPSLSMAEARREAEQVMFGAVDALLQKTGVDPKDIGVLVVNCSLFNPTPSLSSMLVNRYKMREDVKSYNLGGMGCSAGLISVDLAKHLLHSNPNSLALVVSMENITLNWYFGNDRSMLLANCIFRMGGAASLLSNRAADRRRSKYQLVHTLRTHKGADPHCHGCVYQREDGEGRLGVSLSRELMAVAGDALTTNITTLGPLVLPVSEQAKFFASFLARKVVRAVGSRRWKAPRAYVPDFKKAFEHFCVHAGGRAVLDEVERNLKLSDEHMEPSRSTLHRFGNTSSSSLWYELGYVEAKGRVRGGDRIWQIAFGSGFKCNSAVWRALRDVDPKQDPGSPWADCIHRYPVKC